MSKNKTAVKMLKCDTPCFRAVKAENGCLLPSLMQVHYITEVHYITDERHDAINTTSYSHIIERTEQLPRRIGLNSSILNSISGTS